MKKTIQKLMAALLAAAMVCAMAIPAFAYNPGDTEKENLNDHHGYTAFQIFKGVISKDSKTLSDVKWGKHITTPADFLTQLENDSTIGTQFQFADATDATDAATVQKVLAVISKWKDSDADSIAFARFVCHYLYSGTVPESDIVGHGGAIEIREPGYYLIVDTTNFDKDDFYHAYNSFFLVNVPQAGPAGYNVPINPKVVKPTVEKKVFDNFDNQDGTSTGVFGSSADHAINEKFQFQLIAKLPASEGNGRAYDYYDTYTVCFNDTLSQGITYDGPYSVVIESNGGTYDITDSSTIDTSKLKSQNYFEVKIPDVKTCVAGLDLNDGATITVTYTAHLNEKATVNTTGGAPNTDNENSVFLTYSNNPRINTSVDKTIPSKVCVYTYQLNNTKYHDSIGQGNELKGAGFKLYSDKDCKNEVELYQEGNLYYPIKDAKKGVKNPVEMFSDDKGQFNVKGLDAGTYYLKETTTPDGYSACTDTKIVISATHNEYNVTLSGDSNLTNNIVNKKAGGITLPSTGGMGTTLFYVIGGGLMVAAIVLLVTKKRMENK